MKDNLVQLDNIEPIDIRYAAGFIDADGCITMTDSMSGTPDWELNAVQTIKNGLEPLYAMQARWGGGICRGIKPTSNKHSQTYRWKVKGIEAAIAVQDLYPFLVIKKERAIQMLEYFTSHKKYGRILDRIKEPFY